MLRLVLRWPLALVLLSLSGCDLFDGSPLLDGPPLEVEEGAALGVAFGPAGNLRFSVPEDLYEAPFDGYRATVVVETARLPNQTHAEQRTLWQLNCDLMTALPRSLEYGFVPNGCQETTRADGILPGRQMSAYVVAANVQATGNTIRRLRSATFQVNEPEAVVRVERSGDAVTFSWPQSVVETFGGVYEVEIYEMAETANRAAATGRRIWRMVCRGVTTPSPRLTSLTPGPGPEGPTEECFVESFTAPEFEPARYAVILRLREDIYDSQAAFASVFEWD